MKRFDIVLRINLFAASFLALLRLPVIYSEHVTVRNAIGVEVYGATTYCTVNGTQVTHTANQPTATTTLVPEIGCACANGASACGAGCVATIAAWQVLPPASVTIATALFIAGTKSGVVISVTSTAPCPILSSSFMEWIMFTGPEPTPEG